MTPKMGGPALLLGSPSSLDLNCVPVMAKHPRISHVTGGCGAFSEGLEVVFGLVFVADGPSVPKVFGPLGFEKAFTRPFQGQVRVLHS